MDFHRFHRVFHSHLPITGENPGKSRIGTCFTAASNIISTPRGAFFVPAKLREKLGDGFIAAAVMDHCVSLYSMEEWDKLQQGLADMPMTKARKLQRYLSANACDVQVDAQGRILLPRHLLEYAGWRRRPWWWARATAPRSGTPPLMTRISVICPPTRWKRRSWSWASDMKENKSYATAYHRPVLMEETLAALDIRPEGDISGRHPPGAEDMLSPSPHG